MPYDPITVTVLLSVEEQALIARHVAALNEVPTIAGVPVKQSSTATYLAHLLNEAVTALVLKDKRDAELEAWQKQMEAELAKPIIETPPALLPAWLREREA